jgi:hypothetical protein
VSLLPFVIHRDQAVPEALARQRPLVETAQSSQAAADFRCAAEWVMDTLAAQPREKEAPPAAAEHREGLEAPVATGASQ